MEGGHTTIFTPRITQVIAGTGKDRAYALGTDGRLYVLRLDSRGHDVWAAMPPLPDDPPAGRGQGVAG